MNKLVSLELLTGLALCVLLVLFTGCDSLISSSSEKGQTVTTNPNDQFDSKLTTLENQNQQLIQMLEEAEAKLYSQTNELESLSSQLSAAEIERDQAKQRAGELEARHEKLKSMIAELKEAIQANTAALQQRVSKIVEFMPND